MKLPFIAYNYGVSAFLDYFENIFAVYVFLNKFADA